MREIKSRLRAWPLQFWRQDQASILPTFAIALLPLVGFVGAAIDYSRASSVRTALQSALDAAVLSAAADRTPSWKETAEAVFISTFSSKSRAFEGVLASFALGKTAEDLYSGTASASVPAEFTGLIGFAPIVVAAKSTAAVTEADESCILTLDKGQPLSHVSLSLNGAPIINLSNCSIRSNTALDCNGHDGSATKAIAAGGAAGCKNPRSNASVVPDTYAQLAENITTLCGGLTPGVTWEAGITPLGAGVKNVSKSNYTEIHICGNLTLVGSGYLTGTAPTSDTIIIIENGSLNLANNAAINTKRTAIVMTGNNTFPASINFPNGNGHAASLALSPPIDPTNPWQSVALYQDPKLNNNVEARWGPGATFNADGLVYLGNSNVTTDGNTSSSNSKCTKFVMNQFTTNGRVALDFAQTNCAALGLKQWGGRPVRLIK